jgi:DNA-binding transcriptional LysR family regulator
VVCESASPAGVLAAVEAGLAVALFTRCSVPEGFAILGRKYGLPPLPDMHVVLLRSRASCVGRIGCCGRNGSLSPGDAGTAA